MSLKSIAGKIGEQKACEYLEKNGYKIICTNYKTKISEIDIIASDGDCLCFVEVKTRKNKLFGTGAQAINFAKREKMIIGARTYILSNRKFSKFRFDVVEVYGEVLQEGFCVSEINLIKNAFEA